MSSSLSGAESVFARELAEQRSVNQSSLAESAAFAEHRARVTELVCAQATAASARLCVLGAGNCNDLELELVCRRYAEVHLVDIDVAALAGAVARVDESARAKLHCHAPVDLSGMLDVLSRWQRLDVTTEELMLRPENAARALAASLPGPFDVVLSACVLTQLQLTILRALGASHRLFEASRHVVNLTHLRGISALLAPSGAALFVSDVTSDHLVPRRELESGEPLALLAELGARGALFHATNPTLIALTCHDDPTLRRTLAVDPPSAAWLWRNGPRDTFLVYAMMLTRLGAPPHG